MMLADGTPSWQSTVAVLALLGAGLGLLFSGLMAYYMKRQTDIMNKTSGNQIPQPLTVETVKALHEQFADKEDFQNHVTEVKSAFEARDKQRQEDLRVAGMSRKGIYDKIEDCRTDLRRDLDEKHLINEKKIGRINWMLAQLCERNRIHVPSEDASL